jgi:small subunit ribosomal protein S11
MSEQNAVETSAKAAPSRKRGRKQVAEGKAFVKSTFNNTIITIADRRGNVLCSASAGSSGFKGSRKSTPFAAQVAAEKVATTARDEFGMSSVSVIIMGPGPGRESATRAIMGVLKITEIIDDTRIPFNGCRSRKKRRV